MRFDICSNKDRIGITQEILSVFSRHHWNLARVEMHLYHTFVQFDEPISQNQLRQALEGIENITDVIEIDLLPGERRSQHLDAVLSTLQDPILDIDCQGNILLANRAASALFSDPESRDSSHVALDKTNPLHPVSLSRFIDQPIESLLTPTPQTIEITCAGQSFLANSTPVFSHNGNEKTVTGAVLLLQSLGRLGKQISAVQQPKDNSSSLIGSSDTLLRLLKNCHRFSHLDMPVLIQGETGTGKELLARILHQGGSRSDAPFMAINCAALPENLLESELFGYVAGAFSGAKRNGKPGLFELAEGGSIFLDEIGEMSPYLQAKLLRFLQDYSFRRIGGEKEISVNVRIISATHRDLQSMSKEAGFREDLYYRLNVLNLNVPALRERKSDIQVLSQHFIKQAAEQTQPIANRSRQRPPILSQPALHKLMQYHWPGNIRELQNVLFRSVAMSDEPILEPEHISLQLHSHKYTFNKEQSLLEDFAPQDTLDHILPFDMTKISHWEHARDMFEQHLLNSLYPHYPSSRKLAKRLAVSHNTIALKLKKYKIT